eukprot:5785637-Amphidinium_carterae.1
MSQLILLVKPQAKDTAGFMCPSDCGPGAGLKTSLTHHNHSSKNDDSLTDAMSWFDLGTKPVQTIAASYETKQVTNRIS